jgi:hypothetical protein
VAHRIDHEFGVEYHPGHVWNKSCRSDARDGREGVPVEVVWQDGSLAARRPGPHPVRPLTYSAFVDKDDRAPFFYSWSVILRIVTIWAF